jgi:hypothetical protein
MTAPGPSRERLAGPGAGAGNMNIDTVLENAEWAP